MWDVWDGLGVVRALTAVLGVTILLVGVRAYRATRRNSILLFAAGIGTASAGYLLEGVLVRWAGWDLVTASLLESLASLAAFMLLAASLWVRDAPPTGSGPSRGTHPTSR